MLINFVILLKDLDPAEVDNWIIYISQSVFKKMSPNRGNPVNQIQHHYEMQKYQLLTGSNNCV